VPSFFTPRFLFTPKSPEHSPRWGIVYTYPVRGRTGVGNGPAMQNDNLDHRGIRLASSWYILPLWYF
jgi:hypothetical protein